MKKRVLSVVLAVAMMVACFVVAPVSGVSAETAKTISVEATKVDAMPGDTVTVDVNITSNPGIIAMRLLVEYDTSVLTLIGAEDKSYGVVYLVLNNVNNTRVTMKKIIKVKENEDVSTGFFEIPDDEELEIPF